MLTAKECIHLICDCDYETAGEDVQFYLHKYDSGEVVLAFKGSNSKTDWQNNFKFWWVKYKDFFVHYGFKRCWVSVRELIIKRIRDLNPSSITITGHSLGGAIAVLCMEDIWENFKDIPKQCITFGAPKVLLNRGLKKIKERWEGTTQYWNGSDIIPLLPPLGYRHSVKLTHIGDKFCIFNVSKNGGYHDPPKYRETFDKMN